MIKEKKQKSILVCLEIVLLGALTFLIYQPVTRWCETLPIWRVLNIIPIWLAIFLVVGLNVIWLIVLIKIRYKIKPFLVYGEVLLLEILTIFIYWPLVKLCDSLQIWNTTEMFFRVFPFMPIWTIPFLFLVLDLAWLITVIKLRFIKKIYTRIVLIYIVFLFSVSALHYLIYVYLMFSDGGYH